MIKPGDSVLEILSQCSDANSLSEHSHKTAYRISALGSCRRKLAYSETAIEPKPLASRAKMVFRLGHLLHRDIQDLLEMERAEDEVSVRIPLKHPHEGTVIDVKGHIDGILVIDDKPHVTDIKTMALYSYMRFCKDTEPLEETYRAQLEGYMRATELPGAILAYNKNTSHCYVKTYEPSEEVWDRIRLRYTDLSVADEAQPNTRDLKDEPEEWLRDYQPEPEKFRKKPTGRTILPWQCSYCDYVEHCWPEAQLLIEKGNPKYII